MRVAARSHKRVIPYSTFVVGVIVLLIGVQELTSDDPGCDGHYMVPGDLCYEQTIGSAGPQSGVYTPDQEIQRTHETGVSLLVLGGLLVLGAAVVILRRRSRAARDIRGRIYVSPQEAGTGTTRRVESTGRRFRGEMLSPLTLKVPPGTRHRTTLRVRGRGLRPTARRPPGDLLLTVHLREAAGSGTWPGGDGSTISSKRVRASADRTGLRVERFDSASSRWQPHVSLRWTEIQRLSFAADRTIRWWASTR